MSKKQGNMLIQFKQFFEALGLPDDQLKIKHSELKNAGIIFEVENQEHFIISEYSKYALAKIESNKIQAINTNTLNNVEAYYSLSRTYLDEWISILAINFEFDSNVIGRNRMKEIEEEFKNALTDSKVIFEHYYRAFEMYLELVFSNEHHGNSRH